MMQHELIKAWRNQKPKKDLYVLSGDVPALREPGLDRFTKVFKSWKDYYSTADFDRPEQKGLHLGLIPQPYCGDLENAEIYILMLNPGLHPTDYYGELEVPAFRKAAIDNLKQTGNKQYPFVFLNPEFSWHGGYDWWHGKLKGVIAELAKYKNISYAESRQMVSKKIASIELFPYHSKSFAHHAWIDKLESVRLVKSYVNDYIVPKVKSGNATVIVTRQTKVWGLKNGTNSIVYSAGKARSASLSPNSDGGKAIIKRLG